MDAFNKYTLKNGNKISPVNGYILDLMGVYLFFVFIFGILLNAVLLLVFVRNK